MFRAKELDFFIHNFQFCRFVKHFEQDRGRRFSGRKRKKGEEFIQRRVMERSHGDR